MSFSSDIKKELVRAGMDERCCMQAELCAFICFGGNISFSGGQYVLKISTESASAARRCFSLVKKLFDIKTELDIKKSRAGRGGYAYSLVIDDSDFAYSILKSVYLIDEEFENHVAFRINKKIVENEHCMRAFVRGAFLGGGSTTNPEKGYHLEITTHYHNLSSDFSKALQKYGFNPKSVQRKSSHVTYFKGGEEICDFLSFMGAFNCMMEYTNIRIVKDTRNNVNRKVNCETANMDKALNAAFRQLEAIKKIRENKSFDNLPDTLKDVIVAREENPEATLSELAEIIKISKSGTSHRLNKILEIAEKIN